MYKYLPPFSCNISISSGRNVTTWNRAITRLGILSVLPVLTYVWEIHIASDHLEDETSVSDLWGPMGSVNQITFLGQPHSTLGIGQVDLSYDEDHPFQALKVKHATGCVMNPCIRQYTVRTSAGTTSVESTKISDGTVALVSLDNTKVPPWFRNSTWVPTACWVSNYTLLSNEDAGRDYYPQFIKNDNAYCAYSNIFSRCTIDTQFTMCQHEASRQTNVVATLLSGNKTGLYYIDPSENHTAYSMGGRGHREFGPVTKYSTYPFQEMLQHSNLNATLHSVAESLTAMMASIGTDTITGQVGHAQAFVHVRWLWLLYPVVVIFIGNAFVLYTIMEISWIDKGTHIWKNSTLPLIYHGLLEGVDKKIRVKTMELRDMEKKASETVVTFEGVGLKQI